MLLTNLSMFGLHRRLQIFQIIVLLDQIILKVTVLSFMLTNFNSSFLNEIIKLKSGLFNRGNLLLVLVIVFLDIVHDF